MALTQAGAVTGIRRPSPLRDIINAQAPFSRDLQRIEDEKAFREREFGLAERRLISQEEQAASALKIGKTNVAVSSALGLTNLAQTDIGGKVISGIGKGVKSVGETLGFGGTSAIVPTPAGEFVSGFGKVASRTAVETVSDVIAKRAGSSIGSSLVSPLTEGGGELIGGLAGDTAAGLAGESAVGVGEVAAVGKGVGSFAASAAPFAAAAGIQLAKGNLIEFADAQIGTSAGTAVNIGAGALSGFLVGGPVGAAIGAVVGILDEVIDCIIVTACTDPKSPEVEIAREFRDQYMSDQDLRGYYFIGEMVVPILKRFEWFRKKVKKHIVDRWIKVAKFKVKDKVKNPDIVSSVISYGFLGICNRIGQVIKTYTRKNGEVF